MRVVWIFLACGLLAWGIFLGWLLWGVGITSPVPSSLGSAEDGHGSLAPDEASPRPVETLPRGQWYGICAPDGGRSVEAFRASVAHDPLVRDAYSDFAWGQAQAVAVKEPLLRYVAYRQGQEIFWTRKPLRIAAGETLLTDGQHTVRGQCCNMLSRVPRGPIASREPSAADLAPPSMGIPAPTLLPPLTLPQPSFWRWGNMAIPPFPGSPQALVIVPPSPPAGVILVPPPVAAQEHPPVRALPADTPPIPNESPVPAPAPAIAPIRVPSGDGLGWTSMAFGVCCWYLLRLYATYCPREPKHARSRKGNVHGNV